MLFLEDIKIEFKFQGFETKYLSFSPIGDSAFAYMKSTRKTSETVYPKCGSQVHIYDSFDVTLKDIPIYPDMPLSLFCFGHRYPFL